MGPPSLIVFEGESVGSCMLALRDTFGPYLAEAACLLFTEAGHRGEFLDRQSIISLSLPETLPGPYIALIRASDQQAAMGRLALMAAPMHGYGKQPQLISDDEGAELIRRAGKDPAVGGARAGRCGVDMSRKTIFVAIISFAGGALAMKALEYLIGR